MRDLRHLWDVNGAIKWIQVLASTTNSGERYLSYRCTFYSALDTCCHIDATPHEKRTQNVGALEISMSSSYKSALFSAEPCRIIEGQFVRFCTLRIGVWSSPSGSTSSGELARKLQDTHRWGSSRSHFVGGACWQQWQSPTCFNRSRIYSTGGASGHALLGELQDSPLWGSLHGSSWICIAGGACTEALGQTR